MIKQTPGDLPCGGFCPCPPLPPLRRQTALVRGQDTQLFTILGDRPPRDGEATALENLRHLLVGERLCAVPEAMPLRKKNLSSKSPCGVSTYLLVVTRLMVDSCMPMSSPTSRSESGRRQGNPLSRNSRWNFTIDWVTLRSVRCRWSTLLMSHTAERSFCSTYSRASLPAVRSSER